MDLLENMRKRLNYQGGVPQQGRMIEDKLRSLKKALLYSYQAGTMVIENPDYDENSEDRIKKLKELEFRCLMNPDKITKDTDKKMFSVPFKDICLNAPRSAAAAKTSDDLVTVPIDCGDTFLWKETNTRWFVTLKYLEELAYFRADIRKCFPYPLTIDGKEYYFSSIGEKEQILDWERRKNHHLWNKLNYTRVLYIKRDETTLDYFNRFKKVKLPNIKNKLETWEVQAVEPNSVDNILLVYLKEEFENTFEDLSNQIEEQKEEEIELTESLVVYPYDTFRYKSKHIEGANWEIRNNTNGLEFKIDATIYGKETILKIDLLNGKTGEFDIFYDGVLEKHVIVKSI